MTSSSRKKQKERCNQTLTELEYTRFKITRRTRTLTRTTTRILQTLRDIRRFGNDYNFQRALDDNAEILRDTAAELRDLAALVSGCITTFNATIETSNHEPD